MKGIEYVVLPLLHDNEKILLSYLHRYDESFNTVFSLIYNPTEIFGDNTRIIYVQSGPNSDEVKPILIDDIKRNKDDRYEVASGTPLSATALPNWVFVPYNHAYDRGNKVLVKKLCDIGIDVTKLTTDTQYTCEKICKDIYTPRKCGGKTFRDIYSSIRKGINHNSMFLYSGPNRNIRCNRRCSSGNSHKLPYLCFHDLFQQNIKDNRGGCIYTGDGNLNDTIINAVYSKYWAYVGTIQVPHHGAKNSFDSAVLDDKYYCCPISVGNKNSHGHPSDEVMRLIYSSGNCPIKVTEDINSRYTEIIELLMPT